MKYPLHTEQKKYKVREIKYLKPNELQRFFKRVKKSKRDYALFLTIYRYGLRASEATLLTLDDVDFENDKINIKRVKNGISMERMLFSDVRRALKAYLKVRLPKGDALFVGRKGPLSPNRINGLFKNYIKKIAPEMSVHTLRHTCAVDALNQGLDVFAVKSLLGHQNIQSTLVYAAVTNIQVKRADKMLERASIEL